MCIRDRYDTEITGTSNYNDIKGSDVIIITAGIPRKPGMDREDLMSINLGIMKDVATNIKKYAPDWPINQMPIIDKNILRVAIYEIIYKDAIPKVIANESVELAKLFGSESSPKFINGVLGSLIESKEKITI